MHTVTECIPQSSLFKTICCKMQEQIQESRKQTNWSAVSQQILAVKRQIMLRIQPYIQSYVLDTTHVYVLELLQSTIVPLRNRQSLMLHQDPASCFPTWKKRFKKCSITLSYTDTSSTTQNSLILRAMATVFLRQQIFLKLLSHLQVILLLPMHCLSRWSHMPLQPEKYTTHICFLFYLASPQGQTYPNSICYLLWVRIT